MNLCYKTLGNRGKKMLSILNKKTLIVTGIISLCVVCAAVLFGILGVNRHNETNDPSLADSASLIFDSNANEYSGDDPKDKSPGAAGIKIPGYSAFAMSSDSTDMNVLLLNPEGNPCHFVFEMVLTGTGETIYKSQMVEPSKCIEGISLVKPLHKGTYDLALKIHTYNIETLVPMNGADISVALYVE